MHYSQPIHDRLGGSKPFSRFPIISLSSSKSVHNSTFFYSRLLIVQHHQHHNFPLHEYVAKRLFNSTYFLCREQQRTVRADLWQSFQISSNWLGMHDTVSQLDLGQIRALTSNYTHFSPSPQCGLPLPYFNYNSRPRYFRQNCPRCVSPCACGICS
ncbi:hypothetical protein M405DRAFT_375197 [Rhizopogon salebrosus TDB-379]|nr:hypothetical protein M405DRAFT_375197 [Rhizopogon salebrosus TDB-379]